MKMRDDQIALAKRVCDEALAGRLDLQGFYNAVGDLDAFTGFPETVIADVLDFIEHETEGQEWQKLDLVIDGLLLARTAADGLRIEARAWLRKNLRADVDIGKQVDDCLERLAAL
jgi:hypothetical protein